MNRVLAPPALAVLVVVVVLETVSATAFSAHTHAGPARTVQSGVAAVAAALGRSQVVEIGEIHYSASEHRFFRMLLADRRIRNAVRTIVVEFGNARYQPQVDRYIAGGTIPIAQVRRAWEETTQGSFWSGQVYADFFRFVRQLNLGRSPSRRYRIALGDPPIDLTRVTARRPLDFWVQQRDIHLALTVQQRAVGGGRVIVIVGFAHAYRSADSTPNLTNLLEGRAHCATDPVSIRVGIDFCSALRRFGHRHVLVIAPASETPSPRVAARLASWQPFSIGWLANAGLGRLPAAELFEGYHGRGAAAAVADGALFLGS